MGGHSVLPSCDHWILQLSVLCRVAFRFSRGSSLGQLLQKYETEFHLLRYTLFNRPIGSTIGYNAHGRLALAPRAKLAMIA